ncbi:FAD-dependent monooxygenase [bacterium SCSIO 12741]|nr:FAD-dependent monooxygenase [bacterium SCSIO 12741]
MKVDIIGAGIGGLTTAIALGQKGIDTRIYEQARQLKSAGAGIIIANNAMQVYEKLGLRGFLEDSGNPISSMNITTTGLKRISKIDLKYFERKYKVKNVAIHRGKLQAVLMDHLDSSKLFLDHKLSNLQSKGNQYKLSFENGVEVDAEVIIGADGLNSTVRERVFPGKTIRNARQICWRGVTDFELSAQYQSELNEAWGKAIRFGFVQIAPRRVYWYALKTFNQSANEFKVEDIEAYFQSFSPLVQEIIRSTDKAQIHTAEIEDLHPIHKWYENKVCLLGDAAHATTPNMGQGACQAIEDAWVMAEYLERHEAEEAFKRFQKHRMRKAHHVVNTSWTLGKMAHLTHPVLITLRNTFMRMAPEAANRMQSSKMFRLAPIS